MHTGKTILLKYLKI